MGWSVECVPWVGLWSVCHGLVCGVRVMGWSVEFVSWVSLWSVCHGLVCGICAMGWSVECACSIYLTIAFYYLLSLELNLSFLSLVKNCL